MHLSWMKCVALTTSLLVHSAEASSYQLTYDGVASPETVQKYASIPIENSNFLTDSSMGDPLFPASIAEGVALSISSDFLSIWSNFNEMQVEKSGGKVPRLFADTNCFPSNAGTKCFASHTSEGISFAVESSLYKEFVSSVESSADPQVGVRVDVTMNALPITSLDSVRDVFSRDLLILALPKINNILGSDNALWSIEEKKSVFDFQKEEKASDDSLTRMDLMEEMVLSNTNILMRKHTVSSANRLQNKEDADFTKPAVDIWTYRVPGQKTLTTAMFIDSKLRATTDMYGVAHAELFVHPALLAHSYPTRIAVISDSPLSLLKEIWKHKTVEKIDVIGLHKGAFDEMEKHIPDADDCSSVNPYLEECMDELETEIWEDPASWADFMLSQADNYDKSWHGYAPFPFYDVILLDIASEKQAEEYLSGEFQKKILNLVVSESLIVVNVGSMPSIEVDYTNDDKKSIQAEYLKHMSGRVDLVEAIHVYDEPLGAPFDTTFIMLIPTAYSKGYFRLVRKQPAVIDLDIVNLLHKQKHLPTMFYDGPTHINLLKPNRAWENYYCTSSLGRNNPDCAFLSDFYNPERHEAKTEVKRNGVKGRGLFAANEITKGSFINADDIHLSMHIDRHQWDAFNAFIEDYPDATKYQELHDFMISYGFENESMGNSGWAVSLANMNTFTNHACTEEEVTATTYPQNYTIFSPSMFRRSEYSMVTIAERDVKEGEEILIDYTAFRTLNDDKFSAFLKNVCDTGEGLVPVKDEKGADEL